MRFFRTVCLAALALFMLSLGPVSCLKAAEQEPAFFYIEFHTEAIVKNAEEYAIETELIKRIASILERHKARGSFMFLDIYPRAVEKFGGAGTNAVKELEARGHEIGAHFHAWGPPEVTVGSTIREIKEAGAKDVVSFTTSFNSEPFFDAEKRAFNRYDRREALENMTDDMYGSGITSSFRWCMRSSSPVRVARDSWAVSDLLSCRGDNIKEDPSGAVLAVGHYDGSGYLFKEDDGGFDDALTKLKVFLRRPRRGPVNYFPVAIHDYYFLNPSGSTAVNRVGRINEARLKAFDEFLTRIDRLVADGALNYTTRKDLAKAYEFLESGMGGGTIGGGASVDSKALKVFYVVHIHSNGQTEPEFKPATRDDFEGTSRVVERIAATLESHGARGVFHPLQGFADSALKYQGRDNILTDLERRGHEIGSHVHTDRFDQWRKTREAILNAGVAEVLSISGTKRLSTPVREGFSNAARIGYRIITGNNSPRDPSPMEGMRGRDDWGLGGNRGARDTGAFIHPWRPDYEAGRFAEHRATGPLLYLDHVPPNAWYSGTTIGTGDFERLKPFLDAAVKDAEDGKPSSWGFVTHEVEYQGRGPFSPHNPVDEEAIRGLDNFLSVVDNYGAKVRWATAKEIYKEFEAWERR